MQNLTLSITQLNNYIKNIFDNEELLIGISVYGEVTNLKISNGIAYFDIKEKGAQLSCVKFSTFVPFAKNGDQVLVTGKLNYHVKLGRLSFVANKVEPYGMGELYKKFLELKARLEAEGVFDSSRKKEIPKYAHNIGVVTSETGAVIRDIYHVTKAKNPFVNLIVYPSKVQGVNAEYEIKAGIEYFNKEKNVDVIIVARGGGSFEDLSPFNTEVVARSAYNSDIPIISAVGHETDFTIMDFSSDLRAPTPSVAAELAVFDFYGELQVLENIRDRIKGNVFDFVKDSKENTQTIVNTINSKISNSLDLLKKDVSHYQENTYKQIITFLNKNQNVLNNLITKLEKSNPLNILKNGYAKVLSNGKSVKLDTLEIGQEIETYVDGGIIYSTINSIKERTL